MSEHSLLYGAASAVWQAEQQAQEIAIISAQMMTRRNESQLFFRFAPLLSMHMTPEFKERLGVTSTALAALFANQGDHVRERHSKEAFEILASLPKVEEQLTYIGLSRQGEGKFELVFSHKPGFHLFMAIKFVSALTPQMQDECWISTAYVIPENKLKSKIRTKQLIKANA